MRVLLVPLLAALFAVGSGCHSPCRPDACGQGGPCASIEAQGAYRGGSPASVEAQRAYGASFFAANCARCHGEGGGGSLRAPPLVGPGTLPPEPHTGYGIRKREMYTAMDLVGFATAKMPPPNGAVPVARAR